MNNRSHAQTSWPRRENFSGAFAAGGALSFPVFMLMASLTVVLISGVYQPADALVRNAPIEFVELQPVVDLADDAALAADLQQQLRYSTVISGHWQPAGRGVVEAPVVTHGITVASDIPVAQPVTADAVLEPPLIHPVVDVIARKVVKRHSTGRLSSTKQRAREALTQRLPAAAYELLMIELEAGAADTEYLGLLAVAALSSQKAREAHLIYERLVACEPENEQWWAGLAISRDQLGLDATGDYERALAISEQDSALSQLARARLQETG